MLRQPYNVERMCQTTQMKGGQSAVQSIKRCTRRESTHIWYCNRRSRLGGGGRRDAFHARFPPHSLTFVHSRWHASRHRNVSSHACYRFIHESNALSSIITNSHSCTSIRLKSRKKKMIHNKLWKSSQNIIDGFWTVA